MPRDIHKYPYTVYFRKLNSYDNLIFDCAFDHLGEAKNYLDEQRAIYDSFEFILINEGGNNDHQKTNA